MGANILVVDSNPDELDGLPDLLHGAGYDCDVVRTASDAVSAFAQRRPAAVLVDLSLPDMDGIALYEELRQVDVRGDVPVLFMGDGDNVAKRIEAIEQGGIDFILRPFAAEEAAARIHRQVTVAAARRGLQESVTDTAIDAIVSSDPSSTVVRWNRAAERMFGWKAEEITGKPLETIIPERYRERHRVGLNRVTETGTGRALGRTLEVFGLHRDGHKFPIELSLSTWTGNEDRYYTGIIRDISERKAAEAQLKEYADRLATQHEELKRRHDELERSRTALESSVRQTQKLFSAVTDGLPGAVLNDKYRLDRKIAGGGFGVVYEGTQLALERRVAVKLLRPPSQEDEEIMFERFRREGVSTTRVSHPNAVSIIDLDITQGGFPYLVMEYLEGETLADRLARVGPISMALAARVIGEVCAVLVAAHAAEVVHRDIKPSNVFLVGDPDSLTVKVLDFGIAKLMDDAGLAAVTRAGQFVGTPSYMAPERFDPQTPDTELSDVYAAGVVLYEAITGSLPILPSRTLVETIKTHLHSTPTPIGDRCAGIPADLERLVGCALERQPSDRPSASELEAALLSLNGPDYDRVAARTSPAAVDQAGTTIWTDM